MRTNCPKEALIQNIIQLLSLRRLLITSSVTVMARGADCCGTQKMNCIWVNYFHFTLLLLQRQNPLFPVGCLESLLNMVSREMSLKLERGKKREGKQE